MRRDGGFSRRVALFLVVSLLVASCGGGASTGAPSAVVSAAPSVARAKLTVSYAQVIASYLPIWAAKEAGIFDRHGLDVELVLIAGVSGIPALITGDTNIANIAGFDVLLAAAGGADLVMVANTVPVWPYVLEVAPEIKTPQDLKGKSIGIVGFGGAYDIALRVALPRLGLTPDKDVTFIASGSVPNVTAALAIGAVQGAMSQPPESLGLESKGFHPLINLAELNLPAANSTITMTRKFLNTNRDVAQRYVDSIVEAIAKEKNDRAFAISLLRKYLKTDDEQALNAVYDLYVGTVIAAAPFVRANQFADAIEVLGKTKPGVRTFDLAKILDESLVQSAVDRRVGK